MHQIDPDVVTRVITHLFDPANSHTRPSIKALISPTLAIQFSILPATKTSSTPKNSRAQRILESSTSPSTRHSPSAQTLALLRLPGVLINKFPGGTWELEIVSCSRDLNKELESDDPKIQIWKSVLEWSFKYETEVFERFPVVGKKVQVEKIFKREVELIFEPIIKFSKVIEEDVSSRGKEKVKDPDSPGMDSTHTDDEEEDVSGPSSEKKHSPKRYEKGKKFDVLLTQVKYPSLEIPRTINSLPFSNPIINIVSYFINLLLSPLYGLLLLFGLGNSTPSFSPSTTSNFNQRQKHKNQVKELKRTRYLMASFNSKDHPFAIPDISMSDTESDGTEAEFDETVPESLYHYSMRSIYDSFRFLIDSLYAIKDAIIQTKIEFLELIQSYRNLVFFTVDSIIAGVTAFIGYSEHVLEEASREGEEIAFRERWLIERDVQDGNYNDARISSFKRSPKLSNHRVSFSLSPSKELDERESPFAGLFQQSSPRPPLFPDGSGNYPNPNPRNRKPPPSKSGYSSIGHSTSYGPRTTSTSNVQETFSLTPNSSGMRYRSSGKSEQHYHVVDHSASGSGNSGQFYDGDYEDYEDDVDPQEKPGAKRSTSGSSSTSSNGGRRYPSRFNNEDDDITTTTTLTHRTSDVTTNYKLSTRYNSNGELQVTGGTGSRNTSTKTVEQDSNIPSSSYYERFQHPSGFSEFEVPTDEEEVEEQIQSKGKEKEILPSPPLPQDLELELEKEKEDKLMKEALEISLKEYEEKERLDQIQSLIQIQSLEEREREEEEETNSTTSSSTESQQSDLTATQPQYPIQTQPEEKEQYQYEEEDESNTTQFHTFREEDEDEQNEQKSSTSNSFRDFTTSSSIKEAGDFFPNLSSTSNQIEKPSTELKSQFNETLKELTSTLPLASPIPTSPIESRYSFLESEENISNNELNDKNLFETTPHSSSFSELVKPRKEEEPISHERESGGGAGAGSMGGLNLLGDSIERGGDEGEEVPKVEEAEEGGGKFSSTRISKTEKENRTSPALLPFTLPEQEEKSKNKQDEDEDEQYQDQETLEGSSSSEFSSSSQFQSPFTPLDSLSPVYTRSGKEFSNKERDFNQGIKEEVEEEAGEGKEVTRGLAMEMNLEAPQVHDLSITFDSTQVAEEPQKKEKAIDEKLTDPNEFPPLPSSPVKSTSSIGLAPDELTTKAKKIKKKKSKSKNKDKVGLGLGESNSEVGGKIEDSRVEGSSTQVPSSSSTTANESNEKSTGPLTRSSTSASSTSKDELDSQIQTSPTNSSGSSGGKKKRKAKKIILDISQPLEPVEYE